MTTNYVKSENISERFKIPKVRPKKTNTLRESQKSVHVWDTVAVLLGKTSEYPVQEKAKV